MENREIRPFHQNIDTLIEIVGEDAKVLRTIVSKLPFGFYGLQFNHIAYNIHVKNRNFSFNAVERLFRSSKMRFYKENTSIGGFIAYGYPLIAHRRNLKEQQ